MFLPVIHLAAITPLLSSAAAVLHDEHSYPLLENSDQKLSTSSATTMTKFASKSTKKSQNMGRLFMIHVVK
jgi:hypothetical protein